MLTDRYGLAVSTDSTAVRDAYVRAVDRLLAAGVQTVENFESVIALEPAFALAHAGYARSLALYGRGVEARAAAARAVDLAQTATSRERQHVATLALAIEGKAQAATSAMLLHLEAFPSDAVVLSLTTGVFGLYGMSGLLDREQLLLGLLDRLAPMYGEDAWFLAQHAFAECECGRFSAAESHAERALELDPINGWGAHARAHVYYELGQDEAGEAFLAGWLPTYAGGSLLHSHLSWHAALSALVCGDPDRARRTFDPHTDPHRSGQPPLIALTDAVSMLWRMELAGCAREASAWSALRSYALEKFPKAGMTYVDVHSAIALAVTADSNSWERLAAEVREGAGRQWGAEIAHPVMQGFEAFSRGNWSGAIEKLAPTIDSLVRISGSRAQRDLVVDTLFAAYVRAGRSEEARSMLGGRGKRISASTGLGPS